MKQNGTVTGICTAFRMARSFLLCSEMGVCRSVIIFIEMNSIIRSKMLNGIWSSNTVFLKMQFRFRSWIGCWECMSMITAGRWMRMLHLQYMQMENWLRILYMMHVVPAQKDCSQFRKMENGAISMNREKKSFRLSMTPHGKNIRRL